MRMDTNWFPRLLAVIDADPRSKRRLSLDAGLGANFVQQMITDKKQPGADKLQSLLDALGYTQTIYILTGIEMRPEDEDAIRALLDLSPGLRQKAKALFLEIEAKGDV